MIKGFSNGTDCIRYVLFKIFQLTVKALPFSFSFYTYFVNYVLFLYFMFVEIFYVGPTSVFERCIR